MNEHDDNGLNGISSVALQCATQEPSSQGSSRALALRSPRSLQVLTATETTVIKQVNGRSSRLRGSTHVAPGAWPFSQLLLGVLLGVSMSFLVFSLGNINHTGTLLYIGSDPCATWQDFPRQMLRMHEAVYVGKDKSGQTISVGVESIASVDAVQPSRNFVVVRAGSEETQLLDIHPAQDVALCRMADDLRIAIVARPMKLTGNDEKNLATVWVFDPEMGRFEDYLGVKSTDIKFVGNTPPMVGAAARYSATETSGRSFYQGWRT